MSQNPETALFSGMIDTVPGTATGTNQTPKPPDGSLETHRMISSPPPSRAQRATPFADPAARVKKAAMPSGAQIAAALFDRSTGARPNGKKKLSDTVDVATGLPAASKLRVDKTVCGPHTTLIFVGALSALTLGQIRDEAFTAIGARPPHLCIDLTGAESPDAAALDSLVTIASVALMMGIAFCVRAPAPLICVLETTHLSRLIPLDETDTPCSERATDGGAQTVPSPHVEWLEAAHG